MRILFLLAIMFPYVVNAQCYEDKDKFKGTEFFWCGSWGTGGIMLGALNGIDPIPYRITSKDSGVNLYIKLRTSNSSYSFIKEEESLALLFEDGETVLLDHIGEPKRFTETDSLGVQAVEEALYPVTIELMERIAKSNKIEFAVYGKDHRFERTMKKAQIKHYAEFLKKLPK